MYKYENKRSENPQMFHYTNIISRYYGIQPEACFIKIRKRGIVQCRQLVYYFTKMKNENITWDFMASFFGQDHATAMHGIKTIEALNFTNRNIAKDILNISKLLPIGKITTYPQRNGQFTILSYDPAEIHFKNMHF